MSGKVTPYSVLFYVPNLVGYFRLACLTVALYHASSDWATTVSFYLAAFAGDVVDGFVARALNQCKFSSPQSSCRPPLFSLASRQIVTKPSCSARRLSLWRRAGHDH